MENSPEDFNSRHDQIEESANLKTDHLKLLGNQVKVIKKKVIMNKSEENLGDWWDIIKWTNICIMEV